LPRGYRTSCHGMYFNCNRRGHVVQTSFYGHPNPCVVSRVAWSRMRVTGHS
jgi:hypothetical protein